MGLEMREIGPECYPWRYPRQAREALSRSHSWLQGRGTLIDTQFSSKRRSRSSAAPIGEAGTF